MNTSFLPSMMRHALPLVPTALKPISDPPSHAPAPPSHWCYGRSDWPACPTHTRTAAERWQEAHCQRDGFPHHRPLRIRCSPLQRCELLTQSFKDLGLSFVLKIDVRLAEIDFGEWEGRLWQDLPHTELDAWAADFAHHRLGRTGQSVRAWLHTLIPALQDSGWASSDLHAADDLWITHAGVIRAAQWWWQAGCPSHVPDTLSADAWPKTAPAYGHWAGVKPGLGPVLGTAEA